MLSEIEMSNLRAAMHASPETDNSGDSSTAQDRLLSHANNHYHQHHHNHALNGNGLKANYVPQGGKHPENYSLGAPRPRPMTGSGVVFRRKKKPCWCVLLVLVAIALMAAGISLGVLFGVMKSGEGGGAGEAVAVGNGHGNSSSSSSSSSSAQSPPLSSSSEGSRTNDSIKTVVTESSSSAPQTSPPPPPRPPLHGGQTKPGANWGVSVRRFKAYWHPGDSRVMEVLLSNGTVLQAAGHKGNDGTFRGLYSLSLTDGQGRTTRVRFMGGRNVASVILPHGTVVSLDWSANNADVECKVFQIPPPRGAPGGGPAGSAGEPAQPTSHLVTLQLGVHSYLLRQITRTLDEASATPGAWEEEEAGSTPTPKFCTPRLPVKVTKCGGQYPYDGAFVQGEVVMQTGSPLAAAALPWLRQDDDDECYSEFKQDTPNFFIPLPGHLNRTVARVIAARYWRTAARWWGRVCDVVGTVLDPELERHKVCVNMGASAQTQLVRSLIQDIVYESCSALLTSLHLACRTLDDLMIRATVAAAGSSHSTQGSGGAGGGTNSARDGGMGGSRQPISQELLQKVLANATSLQEPATSPYQDVGVKTHAFCPSTQPLTSFDKLITLSTPESGGLSSKGVTVRDLVHVNCPGQPEVTYYYLGHAAAIEPLNMVKHRLKVCAVCAFEKTFSVHVRRDHMCCNDTCTKEQRCEDSISEARMGLGLSESHTFREQSSVYCHEFLTAADTPTRPLPASCLGSCQSNLEVRFQVKDSEQQGGMGMEGERVYLDQTLTCLEGFRSTCKSTFGH